MKPINSKAILGFYWRMVRHYPRYLYGLLLVIPLTALVSNLLPPLILAHVLSRLASHDYQPHHVWASFGSSLVLYTILELLGGLVFWRLIDYMVWKLEGNVIRDMSNKVFQHLINQSSDFHANHFGGSLVSQTNKLIGAYIRIADTAWFQVLPMLWTIIFVAIILLNSAPLFVVVYLVFALLFIVSSILISRRMRKLGVKHANAESRQTGFLADAITNVMAIKSFAGNDYEVRRYRGATDYTFGWLMRLMRASQLQMSYFSALSSLIMILALAIAVIVVVDLNATIATVFLILSYTTMTTAMLFQFSVQSLRSFNRAIGDASDMVDILAVDPSVQDPAEPEKVGIAAGDIVFDNVTFQHDGSDGALFKRLDLHIQPGEKVGLVGHSGSGKTTFTRLLLRFSDLDSGEILIDNQNIAHITQDDLHRHIAYVPQEPLLFHRSIHENIAYGRPSAKPAEIERAAKQAHAHEFVKDLPAGYETLVGERGVKLSGGQRQRVAIARAMLKNAPILVLDEATSALDSESEVLIQDALWKLMEGRTAIVIAHRLSTVQRMDRIIVLDDGKIVEEGSHKELLEQNGTYAKLWAHQSGGFIED